MNSNNTPEKFVDELRYSMDRKTHCILVLLDLIAAFDTTDRRLHSLIGISGTGRIRDGWWVWGFYCVKNFYMEKVIQINFDRLIYWLVDMCYHGFLIIYVNIYNTRNVPGFV